MRPNKMSPYEIFIGVWNTTGEVLQTSAGPGGTLDATDTYRWLPGQHFIVHEVDARFDGRPTRSMEVIGYDLSKKNHFARSYDDQGVSELFVLQLRSLHWHIQGATMRFSGNFNSRKDRLAGLWELKAPKKGWQPWIKLELVRA